MPSILTVAQQHNFKSPINLDFNDMKFFVNASQMVDLSADNLVKVVDNKFYVNPDDIPGFNSKQHVIEYKDTVELYFPDEPVVNPIITLDAFLEPVTRVKGTILITSTMPLRVDKTDYRWGGLYHGMLIVVNGTILSALIDKGYDGDMNYSNNDSVFTDVKEFLFDPKLNDKYGISDDVTEYDIQVMPVLRVWNYTDGMIYYRLNGSHALETNRVPVDGYDLDETNAIRYSNVKIQEIGGDFRYTVV